jgi:hypothetical protein
MARKWAEVTADPKYQALPPDEQERMRQLYFQQVVVPQIQPDQVDTIRAQFDAETGPQTAPATTSTTSAPKAPQVIPNDSATPAHRTGGEAVADDLLGPADTAAAAASNVLVGGTLHPLADLVSRIVGVDPKIASDYIENNWIYHPNSTMGQAAARAVGRVTQPIGEGIQKIDESMAGHPTLQKLVRTGAAAAGDVAAIAPLAHGVTSAVEGAIARRAAPVSPPVETPGITPKAALAAKYNLKIRPSDVQAVSPGANVPGTLKQGMHDQASLAKGNILHNQQILTREAGDEIGKAGASRIEDGDLAKLRAPDEAVYESAGRSAGKFKPTGEYAKELNTIADEPGFDTVTRDKITKETARYSEAADLNGPDLVRNISVLRRRAATLMRSDDLASKDLGYVNRRIADAMEGEMGRRLKTNGLPKMYDEFQAARTRLAKIHDVEVSLKAGQIDPATLTKLKAHGVPLSGRLNDIADLHEYFPATVRHSSVTADMSKAPGVDITQKRGITKKVISAARVLPGMNVGRPSYTQKVGAMADKETPMPKKESVVEKPQITPRQQMLGDAPGQDFALTPGAPAYNPETGLSIEGPSIETPPLGDRLSPNPTGKPLEGYGQLPLVPNVGLTPHTGPYTPGPLPPPDIPDLTPEQAVRSTFQQPDQFLIPPLDVLPGEGLPANVVTPGVSAPELGKQLDMIIPHNAGMVPHTGEYSPVINLPTDAPVDLRDQLGATLAPPPKGRELKLTKGAGRTPAPNSPVPPEPQIQEQHQLTLGDAINAAQAQAETAAPDLSLEPPLGNALVGSDFPQRKPHVKLKAKKDEGK